MLRKANLILAIVLVMAALGGFAIAQEEQENEKAIQKKIGITDVQRKEAQENRAKRLSEAALTLPTTPSECGLGLHSTVTAGINDNGGGGPDPAFLSPALTTKLVGVPTKSFDDKAVNTVFAYSFDMKKYKPCDRKICRAQLMIRVCNTGQDLWTNDQVNLGIATGSWTSIYSAYIWNSNGSEANKCKNLTIPISNISFMNSTPFLDVLIQDDSWVDYMQLDLDF